MATFSVDYTEVVFAASHTGYKDITITGMPQAGVTCTITGTASSSFGFRIPGSDQNVYRVYTTGLNELEGTGTRSAVFKITNAGDSSDYVEVSLFQLQAGRLNIERTMQGHIYDVLVYDYDVMINNTQISGSYRSNYNRIYVNYSNGLNNTAHCTMLLDGAYSLPTPPDWITLTDSQSYTDTGFRQIYVSFADNNGDPRKVTLEFGNTGKDWDKLFVCQDGYPSSTSGCTSELSFPKNGGTVRAELHHPVMTYEPDRYPTSYGSLYYVFGSGCNVSKVSGPDNNTTYFDVRLPQNVSDEEKAGYVYYYYYTSSPSTSSSVYLGHTVLRQAGSSSQSISVSPSSLQFGDGGDDPQTVTISNATGTVSAQPSESWISVTGSNTTWTVDVSENSGDERTGTVTFTDDSNSTTVSVWQDSPSPVADITVTPRTLSFSAEGGSGTLDVTYTDTLNTNISSFPSWLSMTETSSSEGESTFSVTASQNSSTEGRSFAIEFSNGLHTVTATVNQGGHTSSFSVTPESLTFGKEGGSSNITLINPPSNSINWEFTYDDGSGWADISFSTPTIGTVTVTNNIGTRRTASLKIWNWDFPDDYVLIPITQYGEGFYAIWNDLPVSPSSFTQGEDYHYRISSGNTVLFEGITVPIDSGSLPVPVNIPRIVESYIHSGNPEDIIPDLVLHKLEGDLTVSLYDLEDPSSPVSEGSYSFWNDWSGVNEVYDRTVTLNDPINGKGCPGMIIPFCICSDYGSSFSVDEGRPTGTVTHTLGVPQDHFSYAAAVFAAAGDVSLKDGDGNILTSYDMTHCGQGYLLYRNRYGGWDSFLVEGNIYSYDGYERLDAVYPSSKRKVTDRITIRTRYEINTGWMNDEESGRLVYHLLSSPTVGLDIFGSPSGMIPVTVTVTQAEYKKFRNGRKMVSYTITLEENKDKTVQR